MSGANTDLQSQIADAAVRCFRSLSYETVSVNDICKEAGVARSSFYRVFSSKKDVIAYLFEHTDKNQIVTVEELLSAENDFDRMWIIGDRYISLSKELGVEFNAAMMSMTVSGEIDLLSLGHSVDSWFIRLTRNCQKTGIIRSMEPPELLGLRVRHTHWRDCNPQQRCPGRCNEAVPGSSVSAASWTNCRRGLIRCSGGIHAECL